MDSVEFVAGKLALLEDMQVRISVLEAKVRTLQDVIVAQEQNIVHLIELVKKLQEQEVYEQAFLDRREAVPLIMSEEEFELRMNGRGL